MCKTEIKAKFSFLWILLLKTRESLLEKCGKKRKVDFYMMCSVVWAVTEAMSCRCIESVVFPIKAQF